MRSAAEGSWLDLGNESEVKAVAALFASERDLLKAIAEVIAERFSLTNWQDLETFEGIT